MTCTARLKRTKPGLTVLLSLMAGCAEGHPTAPVGLEGGQTKSRPAPVVESGCGKVDDSCPTERPFAGAPCAGPLECEYVEDAGKTTWILTCVDGAWSPWASCELMPDGCVLIPPPAESCDDPFSGSLQAQIEIGPAGEETFRPFVDSEEIDIVWSTIPQFDPVFFYRLKLTGTQLPTCVGLTVNLESPVFVDAFPGEETVVLRCGESLGMYAFVPYGECVVGESHFDATLRIDVHDVGSVAKEIQLPYEALCGQGSGTGPDPGTGR